MEKRISKVFSLVLFLGAFFGLFRVSLVGADVLFAGGSGTEGDPYRIETCQQLQNMNTGLDSFYVLNKDIDCSETKTWNEDGDQAGLFYGFEPVGFNTNNDKFSGSFNGNNKKISGIYSNHHEENYVGLFGYVDSGATIKSVSIINSDITGLDKVGGLVGYVENSIISQVMVSGNIVGDDNVGGLAGSVKGGSIADCYVNADTSVRSGGGIVGGFVGSMTSGLISNSYSSGSVGAAYGASGEIMGGFIGKYDALSGSPSISNSFSASNIEPSVGHGEVGNFVGLFLTGSGSGGGQQGMNWLIPTAMASGDPLSNVSYLNVLSSAYCYDGDGGTGGADPACKSVSNVSQFYDSSNEPMKNWDFDVIWISHADALPTFLRDGSRDELKDDTKDETLDDTSSKNDLSEFHTAKIDSWEAYQYQDGSWCGSRLKLKVKGHHFAKNVNVQIGGKSASSISRKSSHRIVATFCMDKLFDFKTTLNRKISVTNPSSGKKKAREKIDLGEVGRKFKIQDFDTETPEGIINIQQALYQLGLLESENIIGIYGPLTREAVRKFQEQNAITQTGDVGPITKARLVDKSNEDKFF